MLRVAYERCQAKAGGCGQHGVLMVAAGFYLPALEDLRSVPATWPHGLDRCPRPRSRSRFGRAVLVMLRCLMRRALLENGQLSDDLPRCRLQRLQQGLHARLVT